MKRESFNVSGYLSGKFTALEPIVGFVFVANRELFIKRVLFGVIGKNVDTDNSPMTLRKQLYVSSNVSNPLPQGSVVSIGNVTGDLNSESEFAFNDVNIKMRPFNQMAFSLSVSNGITDLGDITGNIYVEYEYDEVTMLQ